MLVGETLAGSFNPSPALAQKVLWSPNQDWVRGTCSALGHQCLQKGGLFCSRVEGSLGNQSRRPTDRPQRRWHSEKSQKEISFYLESRADELVAGFEGDRERDLATQTALSSKPTPAAVSAGHHPPCPVPFSGLHGDLSGPQSG